MKELCKPKGVVACVTSYPRYWPKTSSTALIAISVKSDLSWERKLSATEVEVSGYCSKVS